MPLSDEQRLRLRQELDRVGASKNLKEASTMIRWPSGPKRGRRVGNTYLRDVLNKPDHGTYQMIELYSAVLHMDWPFIKDGEPETLLLPAPKGAVPAAHVLDFDMLRDLIASALQLYGASPPDALLMAKRVLQTWKAHESLD